MSYETLNFIPVAKHVPEIYTARLKQFSNTESVYKFKNLSGYATLDDWFGSISNTGLVPWRGVGSMKDTCN
jgi:hypothetical protein